MSKLRFWLPIFAGFALLIAAYVVIFRVAHQAQIKEVPLATKGGRP